MELCCPLCNQFYESPPRYLRKNDDIDYVIVPRLLNCLHSNCHSCLEEQYQKSNKSEIHCGICKSRQVTKGVRFIPLDGATIQSSFQYNQGSAVKYCSRCRDETKSLAWCITCSLSFCKLHQKDHIVSRDTSTHKIFTFEELIERNIPISPKLPPVACPEVLTQDCTMYCNTCQYPISAMAMLTFHATHDCVTCETKANSYNMNISTLQNTGSQITTKLVMEMNEIQKDLKEIQKEENRIANEILSYFSELKKLMNQREKQLLKFLQINCDSKRNELSQRFDDIKDIFDDLNLTKEVSNSFLNLSEISNNNDINGHMKRNDVTTMATPFITAQGEGSVGNNNIGCGSANNVYIAAVSDILTTSYTNLIDAGKSCLDNHHNNNSITSSSTGSISTIAATVHAEKSTILSNLIKITFSYREDESNTLRWLCKSLGSLDFSFHNNIVATESEDTTIGIATRTSTVVGGEVMDQTLPRSGVTENYNNTSQLVNNNNRNNTISNIDNTSDANSNSKIEDQIIDMSKSPPDRSDSNDIVLPMIHRLLSSSSSQKLVGGSPRTENTTSSPHTVMHTSKSMTSFPPLTKINKLFDDSHHLSREDQEEGGIMIPLRKSLADLGYKLIFTVQTKTPTDSRYSHIPKNKPFHSVTTNALQNHQKHKTGTQTNKCVTALERVIIEARLIHLYNGNYDCQYLDINNNNNNNNNNKQSPPIIIEEKNIIEGCVIIQTELEKDLLKDCELRSMFESLDISGMPALRVTRRLEIKR